MSWIFHYQQATPSDLNVSNPSTLCPISEWPHILIHSPGGDCYFGCIQYNCYVTQEIGYRGNIPTKFLSWMGLTLTSSCHQGLHWRHLWYQTNYQYNCYVTREIGYRGNIPTKYFIFQKRPYSYIEHTCRRANVRDVLSLRHLPSNCLICSCHVRFIRWFKVVDWMYSVSWPNWTLPPNCLSAKCWN